LSYSFFFFFLSFFLYFILFYFFIFFVGEMDGIFLSALCKILVSIRASNYIVSLSPR